MLNAYAKNTLCYDSDKCVSCGMCAIVCPHGVFRVNGGPAELVDRDGCMECGACSLNCPTAAITVESGVGCAAALMKASLTGRDDSEACCGPADDAGTKSCCG